MANVVGRVTRRWTWSETPPMHLGIIPFCLKFRHSNHRIGAHTCTNHTVPYGTALWGGDRGRDKGMLCPSLRTGLPNFLDQMWSATFDPLCGLPTYVALSLPAVRVVRVS